MSQFLQQVKPEEVAGLDVALLMRITGEGGGDWWFKAREGKVDSGEGPVEKPNATLTCSAEDALALARRETDPMSLLAAGRLTAVGDLGLLPRLLPMLSRAGGG